MAFSLITINADFKYVGQQLRRIADALEAFSPPPAEAIPLKPEEEVTYTDEEKIAVQEAREELSAVEREYERMRHEESDEMSDGGLGVFHQGDRS